MTSKLLSCNKDFMKGQGTLFGSFGFPYCLLTDTYRPTLMWWSKNLLRKLVRRPGRSTKTINRIKQKATEHLWYLCFREPIVTVPHSKQGIHLPWCVTARTSDNTSPFAVEERKGNNHGRWSLIPHFAEREQEHQAVSWEALWSTTALFVMKILTEVHVQLIYSQFGSAQSFDRVLTFSLEGNHFPKSLSWKSDSLF